MIYEGVIHSSFMRQGGTSQYFGHGNRNMNLFTNRSMKPFLFLMILMGCQHPIQQNTVISPNPVVPSANQVSYQQMELIGFIHFSINTFTDKEWGFGDEDPGLFDPMELDAEQWAATAKAAGMKQLTLTAKHHDGFCLWPSKYTEHSIKNSPYKNGKGDIVGEFVEACRKHGLKAGLYLSPWDRNHSGYGKPEYITYYRGQLEELLTQYGEISEIWFDGANGGDGYYGGANETRHIERETYYDWETTVRMVKEWQPDIMVFSDAGPDVRWVGNENGFAGETFWSIINTDSIVVGAANTAYLNRGDPDGKDWVVGQCDVSIRPGWFYHASQDSLVKSPEELVDIYYKSVGRNALLLLNLPPDKRGLIPENDVQVLKEFRKMLDETFRDNLLDTISCMAYEIDEGKGKNNININNNINNNINKGFKKHRLNGLLDDDFRTYWVAQEDRLPVEILIEFPEAEFDVIMLQEPIWMGQRISGFSIFVPGDEGWKEVANGSTIGCKRLLRIAPVKASRMKIMIMDANNSVALSGIGLYNQKQNVSL